MPLKLDDSKYFVNPDKFWAVAAEVLILFIGTPSLREGEWFVFSTCAAECGNVLGP